MFRRTYDPLQFVPEFKQPHQPVDILSVTDLRQLLNLVRPEFLPYLSIAAFAGLRQSEIQRLRWEHITNDYIHVPARLQYRVKSTRLVPLEHFKQNCSHCVRPVVGCVHAKNDLPGFARTHFGCL